MTMAAHAGADTRPCPNTPHTHDTPPQGGRCAYYSPGRPGDICGRTPVAVYENPSAPVRMTYRCRNHDLRIAIQAAAELGFIRRPLDRGEKDLRIAAVDRAVGL